MKNKIKVIFSIIMSAFIIVTEIGGTLYAEELKDEEIEIFLDEFPDEDEQNVDDAVAGKNNEANKEVTIPAESIHFKTPRNNEIVIGETFQIKYSFSPLNSDDYVTYINQDKKIVSVNESGLVKAIGYGEAKIQVRTSCGVTRNIYFTVTDITGNSQAELIKGEATSIDFVDKYAMIKKGETFQVEPIFYPLGIYDNVTYESSDTRIATVSETGLITAKKAGSTIITVTTENDVLSEVEVTVYSDYFRGIDVSKWQGDINWKKVAKEDIDFVMIRSSYGYEDVDPKLKKNVAGCKKYDLDYGFYHYTYAKSISESRKEAKFFLKTIKKYSPDYPLVLDIEENFYKKMSRKKVTDIVVTFMEELENAGYYAMIYCSPSFINECLDMSRIKEYDIWIACWGDEEKLNSHYNGHYGMWQYSDNGSVKGIKEDVDLNYAYKNYAAVIDKYGLNK